MPDILNDPEDDKYEEEWKVVNGTTKAEYILSKWQARILQQAIAHKERAVVFETFTIFIPYTTEFYRLKRFLKGTKQLTARATEKEYVPISPEKWEALRKTIYAKIGNIDHKKK